MKENIKKAIQKFYEIRNIPYHIALNKEEENWDCETKNRKLAEELEKLGYKTRERIGLLRWSELNIPENIKLLPHNDESSHLFLEVVSPGKNEWIIVDCTWNPELKGAGFSIEEWDGKSATGIAFECYKLIPAEKNQEYLEKIDYEEDLKLNYDIYNAFNDYCDSFLKKEKQ